MMLRGMFFGRETASYFILGFSKKDSKSTAAPGGAAERGAYSSE